MFRFENSSATAKEVTGNILYYHFLPSVTLSIFGIVNPAQ
jgi:hypothetical protein